MEHSEIIERTIAFVKQELEGAEGGHDWFHIERVWNNTKTIAASTPCDALVAELAALLHDIADSKFHHGDESVGPRVARDFLNTLPLASEVIDHVILIIENISFKGGKVHRSFSSVELDVVQDADRLDAIGAIGIARTFNYGGFKNHQIYNPSIPPNLNMTKEEYKSSKAPTINHFYEKLLLLKDTMNTAAGRSIAEQRHQFMEEFLSQFYKEWEGSR